MKPEMELVDSTVEIIKSAQSATINAIGKVIADLKAKTGAKVPGLTWDELEFIIEGFKKKEPCITFKEFEV